MSDLDAPKKLDEKGFTVGWDDKLEKNVLVITIPLTACSSNAMGDCLVIGFLEKIKLFAIAELEKKQISKVITRPSQSVGEEILKVVQ